MTTVTIPLPPITLPEDLAEKAKARGLLSPSALEEIVREKLQESHEENQDPDDEFRTQEEADVFFKDIVDPSIYGKGEILGDIISPIDVEWEVMK